MKKIFTLFLVIFSVFFSQNAIVRAESCPDFSKISLSANEVVGKINQCLDARKNGNSASITDFQCPSGNFSVDDAGTMSEDRIAYHITVNLYMNAVDAAMKKFMESLQDERNKDVVAWTETYGSCVEGRPQGEKASLAAFYDNLCGMTFVSDFLNTNTLGKKYTISSDTFPQAMCVNLAVKKKKMWMTMGSFLMQKWIAKSYENDRGYFNQSVQGQYATIIKKFHTYQKIIARASSKIKTYIRDAVK